MFEYTPGVLLDLLQIPAFEPGGDRVHIVVVMPACPSSHNLLVNDGWKAETRCCSLIIQNWRIQPDLRITERDNKMIVTIYHGAL